MFTDIYISAQKARKSTPVSMIVGALAIIAMTFGVAISGVVEIKNSAEQTVQNIGYTITDNITANFNSINR